MWWLLISDSTMSLRAVGLHNTIGKCSRLVSLHAATQPAIDADSGRYDDAMDATPADHADTCARPVISLCPSVVRRAASTRGPCAAAFTVDD
jgi:hypothetical protein